MRDYSTGELLFRLVCLVVLSSVGKETDARLINLGLYIFILFVPVWLSL